MTFSTDYISVIEDPTGETGDIVCNHCKIELRIVVDDKVPGYKHPNVKSEWLESNHFYNRYVVVWPYVIHFHDLVLGDLKCFACGSKGDFTTMRYGLLDFQALARSFDDGKYQQRCSTCKETMEKKGGLVRSAIDKQLYCLECLVSKE